MFLLFFPLSFLSFLSFHRFCSLLEHGLCVDLIDLFCSYMYGGYRASTININPANIVYRNRSKCVRETPVNKREPAIGATEV